MLLDRYVAAGSENRQAGRQTDGQVWEPGATPRGGGGEAAEGRQGGGGEATGQQQVGGRAAHGSVQAEIRKKIPA